MTTRNRSAGGRRGWLLALERALFVAGAVLVGWCLVVLVRELYYAYLPVPPIAQPQHATAPGPRSTSRPPGEWLARLDAPSIQLSATVLEGSDAATLARAAGHIEETALPGESGNVALAGHRDTIFRPLQRLQVGDRMTLTTADQLLRYRVTATKIVRPEDVYVLAPTNRAVLTLVTCYPFQFIGHAPYRFVVRAALVGKSVRDPRADKAERRSFPASWYSGIHRIHERV